VKQSTTQDVRSNAVLPLQAKANGAIAESIGDGLSDTLPTAQAKTDTGLSAPPGGASVPFGPKPVQAKDLSGAVGSFASEVAQAKEEPGSAAPDQPEAIQAKGSDGPPTPSGGGGPSLPSSGGSPLPDELRAQMERSLGADFSAVRVHESSAVSSLGALAFTQGDNIHFAPGKFDPGTPNGRSLLGHELTHVVQQRGGRVKATTDVGGIPLNDNKSLEAEADLLGSRAAKGGGAPSGSSDPAPSSSGPSTTGQRKVAQAKVVQADVDPTMTEEQRREANKGTDVKPKANPKEELHAAYVTYLDKHPQHVAKILDAAKTSEADAYDTFAELLHEVGVSGTMSDFRKGWLLFRTAHPEVDWTKGLQSLASSNLKGLATASFKVLSEPFEGPPTEFNGTTIRLPWRASAYVEICRAPEAGQETAPPIAEETTASVKRFLKPILLQALRDELAKGGAEAMKPNAGGPVVWMRRIAPTVNPILRMENVELFNLWPTFQPASEKDSEETAEQKAPPKVEEKKEDPTKTTEEGTETKAEAKKPVADGASAPLEFHSKKFDLSPPKKAPGIKAKTMVVRGEVIVRRKEPGDLSDDEKELIRSSLGRRYTQALTTKVAQSGVTAAYDELADMSLVVAGMSTRELSKAGIEILDLKPELLVDEEAKNSEEEAKKKDLLVNQDRKKGLEFEVESEQTAIGELVTVKMKTITVGDITLTDVVGKVQYDKKGVDIKFLQGSGKATIPYKESTFDLVFTDFIIESKKVKSGVGTFTSHGAIALGDVDGTQWAIAEGATGNVRVENGAIVEIGAGATLKASDAHGKLLKLTLGGVLDMKKPLKSDFTAEAVLERTIPVTEGFGPKKDWSVFLSEKSTATVVIKKGQLVGISGQVAFEFHDGGGKFLTASCANADYKHGKKPTFSATAAKVKLERSVHLKDVGDVSFFLEPGTSIELDVENNKLTRIFGKLPIRVDEGGKGLVLIQLAGEWSGGIIAGSGEAMLLRRIEIVKGIGPESNWNLYLKQKSKIRAALVGGKLTEISGDLSLGLAEGEEEWGSLSVNGTYRYAEKKFTGDVTLDVTIGTRVVNVGEKEIWIDPVPNLRASFVDNQLVRISSDALSFTMREGGKDIVRGALNGGWTRQTNQFDGEASVEVLSDWSSTFEGGSITIVKGSKATVSMAANALTAFKAESLVAKLELSGKRPVKLTLKGAIDYDHQARLVKSASGSVTLDAPMKISDRISVDKIEGKIAVKENALTEVHGKLEATYADEAGKPLLKGSISGDWTAEKDQVNGSAELTLVQDVSWDLGKGFTVWVREGTGGTATMEAGEVTTLEGKLTASLHRAEKPLAQIAAKGTINLKERKIVELTATAKIMDEWKLLDGGITVSSIVVTMNIVDNVLVRAEGQAEFSAPIVNINRAAIKVGWRNDGVKDYYWFSGSVFWSFFKNKDKELSGQLTVDYKENGEFTASASVKYVMSKGFEATATVEIDNKLDPLVKNLKFTVSTTLLKGQTLFEFGMNIPISVFFLILQLTAGIGFGAKFGMRDLKAKGSFGVQEWRPSQGDIPDFEIELGLDWGFDVELFLKAYLEAALNILLVKAGIGAEAKLTLAVPIDLDSSLMLAGGKDGWGGAFGINMSIKPTLKLNLIPYAYVDVLFFKEFRTELANVEFDLAQFDGFNWNTTIPFGKKRPAAPPKKKKTEKQAPGTAEAVKPNVGAKKPGDLRKTPAVAPKKEAKDAELPGGGKVSGKSMLDQLGGGEDTGKDAEGKTKSKMSQYKALFDGLEAINDFMDYCGAVWDNLKMGPAGVLVLAYEVLFGDLQFSRLASIWARVKEALRVIGDMLKQGQPAWSGMARLGRWLGGEISTWDLIMGADNEVTELVLKKQVHKSKEADIEMFRSFLGTLCGWDNACVGDEEYAVVDLLKEAGRRGFLPGALSKVKGSMYSGADQVLYKLDGSTDTEARQIFKQYGVKHG
jgi:hypothetical protein